VVGEVGEGSDELFWGYPSWKVLHRLQGWDDLPVPRALKRLGVFGLQKLGRGQAGYVEWLRRGAEGVPVFWSGADTFTQAQKEALLSERLRRRFRGRTSWSALEPLY